MNRRDFLICTGALATVKVRAATPKWRDWLESTAKPADHTLRIEPLTLEIGPGVSVKTLAYNGQVPGPLLRLRKGVPVSVDVINNSDKPDIVH